MKKFFIATGISTSQTPYQKRASSILFMALALLIYLGALNVPTAVLAENVIGGWDIPPNSAGLAWDGDLFWIGGVGANGNWIRALDPESGQIVDSIRAPEADCIGLTWFQGRLAYISPRSDRTYFVGRNGNEVAFDNPLENLGGLGVDGDYFWSATYSQRRGTIILMDSEGSVIRSMPYNGRHSRETAFLRGKVYVADRLEQEIRVVNPESGQFIRTFDTPASNPDGLTSDGTFLYLIDDGDEKSTDRLYKLSVPQDGGMRYSAIAHNFGSVVIEDEKVWSLWIYNDGARETELIDFEALDGNDDIFVPHLWNIPSPIAPGDSAELRISFQPAYEDSTHILFRLTYDLDRDFQQINLRGKGVRDRRDILIIQRTIDFGVTRCGQHVNASNLRYLLIENNGGTPLTVESLEFSEESFFHGFWEFPHTFEEPGVYRVPIFLRPRSNVNISYRESVTIISNDPDSPEIRVNLVGQGLSSNYNGGAVLWETNVGESESPGERVRAIQDIDDVSGDDIGDVIIASNDYLISAYHAAATSTAIPIWTYTTDINPWRRGLVAGQRGISGGDDWDDDGVHDVVFGLEGESRQIIALSGRTGEPIWIFDTHGLPGGGGDIIVTLSGFDYNDDDVFDVISAVTNHGNENTTRGVILLDGVDGDIIWRFPTEVSPMDMSTLDDFTGDDINDIIVVLDDGTVIGIDGQRGQAIWTTEVNGEIKDITPTLGDVNGDGSIDLCIVTHSYIVMLNGSNGMELWESRIYNDLSHCIAVNDLNGNGKPDIIYTDDNVARAIDGMTAESAWDSSVIVGTHTGDLTALADFDDDGRIDFAAGTETGRLFIYSGNGRDGLWSYSNVGEGREFCIVKALRDVDGNGLTDLCSGLLSGRVICFSGTWVGKRPDSVIEPELLIIPEILLVDPAYPNPFNMAVNVPFQLRQTSVMNITIMNILGREIYNHQSELLSAGSHRFLWQGESSSGHVMPSGSYFIELRSENTSAILPVNLIK